MSATSLFTCGEASINLQREEFLFSTCNGSHVVLRRLRAYVEAPENAVHNLPADVAQIQTEFSLRKPVSWREQDRWQYMWSSAAQNSRQMQANHNSLSYAATDVESDSVIALELAAARESMKACSAIKVWAVFFGFNRG